MARRRKYGEDLTVAEWHRNRLPELYVRNGHRLDMADRDWTEFCHFCKTPLLLWEEVIHRGQDLNDKGTSVTRQLAKRSETTALLVAPRINRPVEVQTCINRLHAEIRRLEALHPIEFFTLRRLWPQPGPYVEMSPDEFAAEIYLLHRDHHETCHSAERNDPIVNAAALKAAREASVVWTHTQIRLAL